MMNVRGDRYAQQHIKLSPYTRAFWNFTWQEMARFDVPETIDAILERSGSATIQCVGHSQGGTVLLALLATQTKYNQIISHVGLLAPFTFMNRVGFPINAVIAAFYQFEYHQYWPFLPHSILNKLGANTVCKVFDGQICNLFLNFILGPSFDQLDKVSLEFCWCFFLFSLSIDVNRYDLALFFMHLYRICCRFIFAIFQPVVHPSKSGILDKNIIANILVNLWMYQRIFAHNHIPVTI